MNTCLKRLLVLILGIAFAPLSGWAISPVPSDLCRQELSGLGGSLNDRLLGTIELRNKAVVGVGLAAIVSKSLDYLVREDRDTAIELVQMAGQDREQWSSSEVRQRLAELRLIDAQGKIPSDIRDIILSSAVGEGQEMIFVPALPTIFDSLQAVSVKDLAQSKNELRAYYEKIEKIVRYIVVVLNAHGFSVSASKASVNPFYGRIVANGGFALEVSYGVPAYFWTPLGKLEIHKVFTYRTDEMKKAVEMIRERLGLEVLVAATSDVPGEGAVYAVARDLNGQTLPRPVLDVRSDVNFESDLQIWRAVKPSRRL